MRALLWHMVSSSQIVDFIERHQQNAGVSPSFKDIADHFGFRSPTTVADHLRLIRRMELRYATAAGVNLFLKRP